MFTARFVRLSAFCAVLAAATTAAHAQKTWIVDAQRGTGYDFDTIAPAITAAADGDSLVVRAGKYAIPQTVTKAVRLLGERDAILDLGTSATNLTVSGVGVGKTFVLAGFRIEASFAPAGLARIADCQGTVSFEDLVCNALFFDVHTVQIERCTSVFVSRCNITGGLLARNSTVTIDACVVSAFSRGSTILCDQTRATFVACQADGINGFIVPAQAAIGANGSDIRVLAGAGSKLSGGRFGKIAAIVGDSTSTLTLDPLVELVPSGGANPHEGFGTATTRRMPVLGVTGSTIGGVHSITLRATASSVFALFCGLPGLAKAPPFGDSWIAPSTLFHITTRNVTAGLAILTIPATKQVSLRGLPATWQALGVDGTNYEMTNAAITTLR
ncbi:MAG: hypothetical protein H6834_01160 [Planctomycetes bacterium]|nr:hypothetical protein [Planctomycetota bacterium]